MERGGAIRPFFVSHFDSCFRFADTARYRGYDGRFSNEGPQPAEWRECNHPVY